MKKPQYKAVKYKKGAFDEKCYKLIKAIPAGKVTTYQEIAKALSSKAFRAVGNAMNRNKNAPSVPCHRVICSDGKIGGYAFGVQKKIGLLRSEGVNIEKGGVVSLEKFFYKLQ